MAQDYGFSIVCACCPNAPPLMVVTGGKLEAWRAMLARGGGFRSTCASCGCDYTLVDGTTKIDTVDVSAPAIASIGTVLGPKAGGTSVVVVGHRLNFAAPLVVKFEGVPGTDVVVSDEGRATVKTPAAPFVRVRVIWPGIVGALGPNQMVTGAVSGKTGKIVGGNAEVVFLENLSGALTPGEWLEKDANNKVQVAAADIYAPGDVTVENVNGVRDQGGKLAGAFTFTP